MVTLTLKKKNESDESTINNSEKQKRYELLIKKYHKDLYRYAYWIAKDQHIAEDLVQETCLRAWRSIDNLQDENAAKAWLITILRRENARRFERKQFNLVDIDEQNLIYEEDDTLEFNQKWLHRHILKLAPEYREPLVLQIMAGFNGDEIANILLLKKSTVMTRLFRARNLLKNIINNKS